MSDETPPAATDSTAPTPTMRRICCLASPQRRAPSLAEQMWAAAVWAQLFQQAAVARERAQEESSEER